MQLIEAAAGGKPCRALLSIWSFRVSLTKDTFTSCSHHVVCLMGTSGAQHLLFFKMMMCISATNSINICQINLRHAWLLGRAESVFFSCFICWFKIQLIIRCILFSMLNCLLWFLLSSVLHGLTSSLLSVILFDTYSCLVVKPLVCHSVLGLTMRSPPFVITVRPFTWSHSSTDVTSFCTTSNLPVQRFELISFSWVTLCSHF